VGLIIGVSYNQIILDRYEGNNEKIFPGPDKKPDHDFPKPIVIDNDSPDMAGSLKWSLGLAHEELSTPAICDLDPNNDIKNRGYEVVVASASDKVCAVDCNGYIIWEFSDCTIDNINGYFNPGVDCDCYPPFFSSLKTADIQQN